MMVDSYACTNQHIGYRLISSKGLSTCGKINDAFLSDENHLVDKLLTEYYYKKIIENKKIELQKINIEFTKKFLTTKENINNTNNIKRQRRYRVQKAIKKLKGSL